MKMRFAILLICFLLIPACGSPGEIKVSGNETVQSTAEESAPNKEADNELYDRMIRYKNMKARTEKQLEDSQEIWALHFAQQYDICCGDLYFHTPEDLSDGDLLSFFTFIQHFICSASGDANEMEKLYYRDEEFAVVLPVQVVRQWLYDYLGTDRFDPNKAMKETYDDNERFRYDKERDVCILPSLSGFGGANYPGLLEYRMEDGIADVCVGFYSLDSIEEPLEGNFLHKWVDFRVQMKEDGKFNLLSWTGYECIGNSIVVLDLPQM